MRGWMDATTRVHVVFFGFRWGRLVAFGGLLAIHNMYGRTRRLSRQDSSDRLHDVSFFEKAAFQPNGMATILVRVADLRTSDLIRMSKI
jgi:hypothetical protein